MMYVFMQLDDGTEVVHSEAYDDNGTETVSMLKRKRNLGFAGESKKAFDMRLV